MHSVPQEQICSNRFKCCHTEIQVADRCCNLIQSQYTDTRPTSLSVDPAAPGPWQERCNNQSFQPLYHFIVLPRAFHSIFFHLIVFFIEKKCLRACFKNSLQQHPHAGTLTGGSFACSSVTSKKNSSVL